MLQFSVLPWEFKVVKAQRRRQNRMHTKQKLKDFFLCKREGKKNGLDQVSCDVLIRFSSLDWIGCNDVRGDTQNSIKSNFNRVEMNGDRKSTRLNSSHP